MDRDGTKDGYDIELLRAVTFAVKIPVIASGGAGNLDHLLAALNEGKADAVLAASIFHFREYSIREAKEYLLSKSILDAKLRVDHGKGVKNPERTMNILGQLKFDSERTYSCNCTGRKVRRNIDDGVDEQRKSTSNDRNQSCDILEPITEKVLDEGEESGHVQEVRSIHVDCDGDVVLLKVHQVGGAACHTGHRTCFYREIVDGGRDSKNRTGIVFDPNTVYKK